MSAVLVASDAGSITQTTLDHAGSVKSLWRYGLRAHLVRHAGEHIVLVHHMDRHGAVISGGVVCQLGEMVVLTVDGIGHISGHIQDRCRQGIRIRFEDDPSLVGLMRHCVDQHAGEYVC